MSDDAASQAPLPPARQFSVPEQRRLALLVAAGMAGAAVLAAVIHWALAPDRPAPEVLPPDAFRPTPAQLAGLRILPARLGANVELVRASGSIAVDADQSTPILLPYSGQVLRVMVEPGQRVGRGEALLEVASPELVDARNAFNAATAQAAAASEAALVSRRNAERQKAIFESACGAQKDFLQAQADAATAQGAQRTAQSALSAARARLALYGQAGGTALSGGPRTVYRSPVPGIVADRAVAPGQFVAAGGSAALMTIADLSRVWLVAQLAESDAALVHVGDSVEVTTPALPGRVFKAMIDNVGAALDPATHRLPVRATIANAAGLLKPQMFASFTIRRTLQGAAGVLVPAPAVIHEGDAARVWTLGNDRLLHGRPVIVGETEGGLTRIVGGLNPGDRVVVSGALFVNEAGTDQ